MSIGLYDADMMTYTLVPFNLEIMKLSAYYKNNHEIVVLAPAIAPERHQKFFYRKDYDDGNFPTQIFRKKIEFGGYAFSNNQYVPLDNEIESIIPDTSIYEKMENIIKSGKSPLNKKVFDNMISSEHCRISLDGKSIWDNYNSQFQSLSTTRNLIFHDYDLNSIDDGYREICRIVDKCRKDGWQTRIGMKFPVQLNNGDDLIKWSIFHPNSTFYSIQYNGIIPDDAFNEWIGFIKEKSIFSSIYYYITNTTHSEKSFLENDLIKIYKQIILSRTYCEPFRLKYDEDFFSNKKWCRVIDLFNYYIGSYYNKGQGRYLLQLSEDSLYDFAAHSVANAYRRYKDEIMSREEMRELFAFVREENYTLFKMFYECNAKVLGGKL